MRTNFPFILACELGTEEIASVEEEILELQQKKEGDAGQVLSDLEAQLKESVKEQTKMEGVMKSLQSNIKGIVPNIPKDY